MKKHLAIAVSLVAFAAAVPAHAAYVLNTNGGDGFVVASPGGFTLFGTNAGFRANTTYTDIAAAAQTIKFSYTYKTFDIDGSFFDPAGYIINGVQTQLSTPLSFGGSVSGMASYVVNAGDSFGFYVDSIDGGLGRAQLEVGLAAVPEPATWAMMFLGFGLVGGAMRFRKAKGQRAFA